MAKSILKNTTPPEWKEADEIVRHVWLGTLTENQKARTRNISDVICISKEPKADLQREGFRRSPDLDVTIFTLESDTEGDLLSIFDEICSAIYRVIREGEGVLVWDVGGGVAGLAAYIMKRHDLGLPEAMTVITRARLMRAKPTLLPSQRIIEMLHNDHYLRQLDMWEACKYDIFANIIVNPDEPREKWIVERVEGSLEQKRDDVKPFLERQDERFPYISEQVHRLSLIKEVEEEAQEVLDAYHPSTIEEVAAEAHRLSTIYEE